MKLLNENFLSQLRNRSEQLLLWPLRLAALISGLIVVLIFLFILIESIPILRQFGLTTFFTSTSWNPKQNLFNLVPMIAASLLSSVGALLLAAPGGVLLAIFCKYYAPEKIAWIFRRMIELLSGIPSVVFGLWGLTILVPWIGENHPPGASLLAGIFILAIMILPTMALTADASFSTLPLAQLRGAAALGLSRHRVIFQIILPTVQSALTTGLILQTGRALGETMAILMVAGNVVQMPGSIFTSVRTLTANMALEMSYASDTHRSALFLSGLVLVTVILLLVTVTHLVNPSLHSDSNA